MFHAHKSLKKQILEECNSLPQEIPTDFRGTYKSWTDTGLSKALTAVDAGLSIRKVAEMYGIPKSTLHDHMPGKVPCGAKCGPDPYKKRKNLQVFWSDQLELDTHIPKSRCLV